MPFFKEWECEDYCGPQRTHTAWSLVFVPTIDSCCVAHRTGVTNWPNTPNEEAWVSGHFRVNNVRVHKAKVLGCFTSKLKWGDSCLAV